MDRNVLSSPMAKTAFAAATALSLSLCMTMGGALAADAPKASTAPAAVSAPAAPAKAAAKPAGTKVAKKKKAKKPVEEAQAAPPPNSLEAKAMSYELFNKDLDTISKMEFKTPKDVKAAYSRLLKHQPEQISAGWMVYSAQRIAKNDEFAKAVKDDVTASGKDAVLAKITKDSKYVSRLPGAFLALDNLMTEVANETSKLSLLGDRLIKTAYDFQKQKWGALETPSPRYADADPVLGGQTLRVMPASFFGDLFSGSGDSGGSSKKPGGPAAAGASQRILMMAASISAGAEGSQTVSLAKDDQGLTQCLRWARLNLNQCLAAAHFPSENAYCTGKHGINEASACWTKLLPAKS